MSITEFDLVPGGFYRHKETGEVYRLNLSVNGTYKFISGNWVGDTLAPFEPIPLTAEILTQIWGWEFEDGYIVLPFLVGDNAPVALFDLGGHGYWIGVKTCDNVHIDPALRPMDFYQAFAEVRNVHELQRIVLALTGKPLEGGPA